MKQERVPLLYGNSPIQLELGKALISHGGGWTMGEIVHEEKSLFSKADFERALKKVSRPKEDRRGQEKSAT